MPEQVGHDKKKDGGLDMPAALGGEVSVYFVLFGHEEVKEPVFLFRDKAKVTAGAFVAAQDGLLVEVVDHGLPDFVLNGAMLYLIAVLVVLLVHLFRGIAYTEPEQAGGKDYYAKDAYHQMHSLDEAQHGQGGANKEYGKGDELAAVILKD